MVDAARITPLGAHAPGVSNRIRASLPELSEAMAKIADYLLENPQAPLKFSIGQLAAQAGTSTATVTRFCREIGFSGYAPLRVSIATDFGRSTARDSWKTDIGRAFGPDDSPADVLSTLVNAHERTLRETAGAIDLALVKSISDELSMSTHVDIYGIGGSAILASELRARLYRIGIPAHAWSEVHDGLTSAAILPPGSVAIGISNSGRTEETIQMLREARRSGALTVALSSNPRSPLADVADQSIVTSSYEQFLQPDDLPAKHGQLLVLDLLYLLVAQQNFTRTTANLAASALAVSTHRRSKRAPTTPPKRDRKLSSNAATSQE